MGQQQLLLLVIGVIIVALSTFAALYILERHFEQDEADGLLDRSLAIATHAVYWKTTNDPFNGGNQSYERLEERGLQTLALDTTTIRGAFAITGATANTLEITGVSSRYPRIGVRITVDDYDIAETLVRFDSSIVLGD